MTEIKTRLVDATIRDKDGNILGGKENFEIPEFWDDKAALIAAKLYANDNETSAIQIIDRVVNQIAIWGVKQNYFGDTPKEKDVRYFEFRDNLRDILINQRACFNTPIMINIGSEGYQQQSTACMLADIEDNMESIAEHVKVASLTFKNGSGIGVNVSNLRGKGEFLSNGGISSGPCSFMRLWDKTAVCVKSAGRSRRAANLIGLDIDHPDIEEFINCKTEEEKKAKLLIEAGISPSEAYSTVDYQNSNHSVIISDAFMNAVEKDLSWNLINKGNKQVSKTIKARDLFHKIAEQAWYTGDPGVQFIDTINKFNPIPNQGQIRSSNVCGEVYGIPWTSCLLCGINIIKYPEVATSNYSNLERDVKTITTALDILIDNSYYPDSRFAEIAKKSRPLGIGMSNLGGFLITQELAYNSVEGRKFAKDIMRRISFFATKQSIELAKRLDSFEYFKNNKEECASVYLSITGLSDIYQEILKFGIRNSAVTALAPNGSSGIFMGCDTYGIEPLFALEAVKQLSDGSTMKMVPKCVEEYKNKHHPIYTMDSLARGKADSYDKNYDPEVLKTANEIHWKDHLKMVSELQACTSQGISKTANLSSEATIEDIKEVYMTAWKLGIKGFTVYRDGCKSLQPLTDANKKKVEAKESETTTIIKEVSVPVRTRLSTTRDSKTHKFEIGGFEGYITVGLFEDGSPGELFIRASKAGSTINGLLDSFATMVSLGLQYGVPLDKLVEKFKSQTFQPNGFTTNPEVRTCSSIIDYIFKWIENEFVLKPALKIQEEKIEEELFSEIETYNTNILEGKIKAGSLEGPPCQDCGGITQKVSSCFYCTVCGTSSGCS